ncbi:MAG: two-component sensor histidine kinase [Bacteroidetes bacterium]|nr:two-component sensor histidine kinase [Bacteroidota bacterium]
MGNESKIELSALLGIATLGIVLMILFIILFVLVHQKKMLANEVLLNEKESSHQKVLLNASLEIAEQERAKVAANIHDDIGMMLHVIKLNVNKARRNLDNKEQTTDLLVNTNKIIEDTIDTIRSISSELMPPSLVNLGFIEGITEMCNQVNSIGIIEMELKKEVDWVDLDKKNAIQLYRLLKEVLNNIIKHTKASKVEMAISSSKETLTIVITHNGKGITNEAINRLAESTKGIGLKSIQGRAQLIDATVQYIIVGAEESKIIVETALV